MTSVFAVYESRNYPFRFAGTLHLHSIAGGFPADQKVLEGHLKRKVAAPDDLIRAEVAEAMIERGIEADVAVEQLASVKGLVGFRRDPKKGLWIPGANLKAALREAANIAALAGKITARGWGDRAHSATGKALLGFIAEHVFVLEDRLYLGVHEPSEVVQSFVHKITPKGPVSAIQYTEVVYDADVDFTVETDWEFSDEDWAAMWLTGQRNGIGAARKMGYGTYEVTRWERVEDATPRRKRAS